jgi:transposase
MLHLNSNTNYYWYNGAADMRKSFDALCGMVQQQMQQNILSGSVYIFMNRKRNQVKLLTWEGDGLSIYYKRLEKGVYELPVMNASTQTVSISSFQLQLILQGVILGSVRRKKRFSFSRKSSIAL